jgi:hypothetical protein
MRPSPNSSKYTQCERRHPGLARGQPLLGGEAVDLICRRGSVSRGPGAGYGDGMRSALLIAAVQTIAAAIQAVSTPANRRS